MQYFPDRFVKREIQALKVQCRGCNWEGSFAESSVHFSSCRYSIQVCQFCAKKVPYIDFDRHTESCEVYSSQFERELSHAQQETNGGLRLKNLVSRKLVEELQNLEMEIITLCTQISELKRLIQPRSADAQNGKCTSHPFYCP